ncbi:MAG: winged-helix domain-containing protein [Ruminococcaceae bacterium]|nr:winged-helix domain-containing protein [Oscillospiraceae bacterium]
MKITIITKDAVFSRMLFWDISLFGAQVTVFEELSEEAAKDAFDADFAVIGAEIFDYYTEEISNLELTQIILFGYKSELSRLETKIPSGFRVFERPFCVQEFLGTIFERADEALLGVRPAKRRKSAADSLILGEKNHTVSYRKETVELTQREFALLLLLIKNKGQTVTRAQAAKEVWGKEEEGETNVVDVYVRYLREKLDERFGIKIISTVRGVGYTIKAE